MRVFLHIHAEVYHDGGPYLVGGDLHVAVLGVGLVEGLEDSVLGGVGDWAVLLVAKELFCPPTMPRVARGWAALWGAGLFGLEGLDWDCFEPFVDHV